MEAINPIASLSSDDSSPSTSSREDSPDIMSPASPPLHSLVPAGSSSRASPIPARTLKRARVDEEIEEMLGRHHDSPSPIITTPLYEMPEASRDDTYYFSDGSCVLRVESTLFNVHRTIISRDSSLFSTMFELPQGDLEVDGRSDTHPLILPGDSVEAFKNFLWALYALPHELMIVHTAKADLNKLMDIANISFKYHFKSVETWSLDAINDHVNRKESPILTFSSTIVSTSATTAVAKSSVTGNAQQISELVRLAQICSHERLLETMVGILRKLMSSSVQYAHLAMTLADDLNIRVLRGVAYLEIMQKHTVVPRPVLRRTILDDTGKEPVLERTEDIVDSEGRLFVTPEQQLRLLTGYYRLSNAWEHLRTHPISFDHAPACGATWHQHGCTQSWLDFWKEKSKGESVLNLGLADLLGRLKAISKEFDRWGSATYMHHDCRMTARRSILEKIKQIEEKLPDYFSDEVEQVSP